jgi:hypothetical protein
MQCGRRYASPRAGYPGDVSFATRCTVAALVVTTGTVGIIASAHTGGPLGYTSRVISMTPNPALVEFDVLEGDDQVYLYNRGKGLVEVPGYGGEPYLRVTPGGVFRNRNSPATYENLDRYGEQPLPANAKSTAKPVWEKLSDRPAVAWHDHRMHWMNRVPPIAVRNAPTTSHHIQDWTIPIRVRGRTITIRGTLDYSPPPSLTANISRGFTSFIWPAFAGVAIVFAGLTLIVVRRRGKQLVEGPDREPPTN